MKSATEVCNKSKAEEYEIKEKHGKSDIWKNFKMVAYCFL